MGFGFNLGMMFIVLPLTIILLIVWMVTRKKLFGKILGLMWLSIFGLVFLVQALHFFITDKKELAWEDVYGEYVIDRTKYPGRQADWQYDHFRFEITKENKFLFYQTEGEKIVRTYHGTMEFLAAYRRPRIIIHMEGETHHIIETKPTLYRTVKGFYYVFYSAKFNNVFFKKGKWELRTK